jgi:HD-like signal output (HDOD) protein
MSAAAPALSVDALDGALRGIRIPPCPATLGDVMREAQKDEPDLRVLGKKIAMDVGMSAMALKLANSAMFGSGIAVNNVGQAAKRLGINNLLSVVIAASLSQAGRDLPAELMTPFWARASSLALASAVIARRLVGISADSAYTYALFHDAGIPVMMMQFPAYAEVYAGAIAARRRLERAELEHFQSSHALVGWLLARNWGLPAKIGAAIRFHHEPELFSVRDEMLTHEVLDLIAVGVIAEQVLTDIVGAAGGEATELVDGAIAYLGITAHDLDEYRELVAVAIQ